MNSPQMTETRVNAMLAIIQQQRDAAVNQTVMMAADLADVNEQLNKAVSRLKELEAEAMAAKAVNQDPECLPESASPSI